MDRDRYIRYNFVRRHKFVFGKCSVNQKCKLRPNFARCNVQQPANISRRPARLRQQRIANAAIVYPKVVPDGYNQILEPATRLADRSTTVASSLRIFHGYRSDIGAALRGNVNRKASQGRSGLNDSPIRQAKSSRLADWRPISPALRDQRTCRPKGNLPALASKGRRKREAGARQPGHRAAAPECVFPVPDTASTTVPPNARSQRRP